MASTSSNPRQPKYDVFISFSGADVRDGFLSHLFEALCESEIDAFKDENLDRGEQIEPALMQTIEESHISIVIFSENYAYSSWCLDELVKIMNCKIEMGQIVLPVFYRIDPSDVQELMGNYGDAFVKHAEQFQDKVESWRLALTETAVLSGFVSQDLKPESKLIYEIVKDVSKRLNEAFSSDHCDDGLVGMESRLEDVEQLLDLEATDVRFIGIWGMGGIGKTTLASKVFDRFCSQFEGKCFISNLREELTRWTQSDLQRKILSKLLGKEILDVGMPITSSSSIRKWIKRKKVLIVLDDVWDLDVVEFLVGEQHIYAPGSRIIITSRDKKILQNINARVYQVQVLNYSESLQLFSLHAFRQNHPTEAFLEVARKAVEYARGCPLALRVLGSNLYSENKVELWEDQLKKLEKIPDKKIEGILRISYDDLGRNEKDVFLDIACFFCSEDREGVERMLESCLGRFGKSGISCLLDKCLINISENRLQMHDLIRQMGKDIVEMECVKNPGDRSRLWNPRDIYKVLSNDMGTMSVESISLDITSIIFLELSPTPFVKMRNLRFLKFYCPCYSEHSTYQRDRIQGNIYLSEEGLNYLPDELRYLYWFSYPLKSFPFHFCLENLLQLHLIRSNIQQLCNENQCLDNLNVLDLSYSVHLIKVPDLSELPKLEVLRLRGCISLVGIHSSVRYHKKLSHLDLQNCKSLCIFPKFIEFTNLDTLCLEGCLKLTEFPKAPHNLKHPNLSETAIQKVPPSMVHHSFLSKLELRSCSGLGILPSSISNLNCLEVLDLGGCSNLRELTEFPCNIKYLYLDQTAIQEVPSSIGDWSLLIRLSLRSCTRLESLPDAFCNLKALEYFDIRECRNLKELPENLGNLESLMRFDASSSGLEKVPLSINSLRRLQRFYLDNCTKLMLLPLTGLMDLQYLHLRDCGATEISICTGSLVSLTELRLSGNPLQKLTIDVGSLVSLRELCITRSLLEKLPTSIGALFSLTRLDLSKNLLKELPTCIGSLVSIEELNLSENRLEELPTSIGLLVSLTKLDLSKNLLKVLPTSIGSLVSIEELDSSENILEVLPTSIGSLVSLRTLVLSKNLLEELPTSIGSMVSLIYLSVSENLVEELPTSIGSMASLRCLDLRNNLLKVLPTSIGSLVSLTRLYLSKNLLKVLPTSIGSLVSIEELDLSENILKELPTSIGLLVSLTRLDLSKNLLKVLPTSIGSLVSIEELNLSENRLEELPTIVEQLSQLQVLDLQDCKRITCLSNLPSSLKDLNVTNCTSLESMPSTQGNGFLRCITAFNCMNLNVKSCQNIVDEMLHRFENFSRDGRIRDFFKACENFMFITRQKLDIPGDEVPQQMKHRNNNGSSLECPLRQDPFDFMVLNFCAVVTSDDHSCTDIAHLEGECNLESECGQLLHSHFGFEDWPFHCNWSSEHVLLWQGAIRICSSCIWKKASFKFYIKEKQCVSSIAVVIKCGVDILYNDNDIYCPSFKHEDWNEELPFLYGDKMMYGSTEEEARANCGKCQEAWANC